MKSKLPYIVIVIILICIILLNIGIMIYKNKGTEENQEEIITELNGLAVTNIEVNNIAGDLEIITTLKNNTNSDIEGFFIEMNLLNNNNEIVTALSENSVETINKKSELTITNYVVGLDISETEVITAELVTVETNTIQTAEEEMNLVNNLQ